MTADLPRPEKRRGFTPRQRNEVANRQNWLCNYCKCDLYGIRFDVDHIQRLDALGKHEPSNWQALCVPCHKRKSKVDNFEAKKGARIRGETGNGKKKQIPSRPFMSLDPRGAANFGGLKKKDGVKFDWKKGRYRRVENG